MTEFNRGYIQLTGQRGMTLIEILIALAISIVLLTGVMQIFISSKQSYRVLEATSRLQENGRFSIGFITEDLRMAGYTGCYNGSAGPVENILNNSADYNWNVNTALEGNEWNGGGWTPALDPLISGDVLNNTDVYVTRGLASDGISLVNPFSNSARLFVEPANSTINDGDILMVTDCTNASIFQVTNQQLTTGGTRLNIVHSAAVMTPGNTGPQLTNSFGADAQLARFVSNVYYIATGASGEPALFRQALVGAVMVEQELVGGVENMQVSYGEDTDNDGIANRYVGADNVVAMVNVASVRISLLLRTADNIASSAQTYTYDGAVIVAGDLRIRRVFTTTVKLRNRGV